MQPTPSREAAATPRQVDPRRAWPKAKLKIKGTLPAVAAPAPAPVQAAPAPVVAPVGSAGAGTGALNGQAH
jgi:hypothetical protein